MQRPTNADSGRRMPALNQMRRLLPPRRRQFLSSQRLLRPHKQRLRSKKNPSPNLSRQKKSQSLNPNPRRNQSRRLPIPAQATNTIAVTLKPTPRRSGYSNNAAALITISINSTTTKMEKRARACHSLYKKREERHYCFNISSISSSVSSGPLVACVRMPVGIATASFPPS